MSAEMLGHNAVGKSIDVVTGGTDTPLLLINLSRRKLTGADASSSTEFAPSAPMEHLICDEISFVGPESLEMSPDSNSGMSLVIESLGINHESRGFKMRKMDSKNSHK